MATVYKKIGAQTVRTKQLPSVSADDKTKTDTILSSFVNLFKQKHLS